MIFKIYDCDFGVTIRGVNYDFDHIDSVTIENTETTTLTRGANAKNKSGIVYKTGSKDPKVVTAEVLDIPFDLHNLLKEVHANEERLDFYCISRSDGSSKIAKNAVLSQEPVQMAIDETAESMNLTLIFHAYDIEEKHKS